MKNCIVHEMRMVCKVSSDLPFPVHITYYRPVARFFYREVRCNKETDQMRPKGQVSRWAAYAELHRELSVDLITDMVAILNKLDLRIIMGCPGGMSTFCLLFTSAFQGNSSQSFLRIRL